MAVDVFLKLGDIGGESTDAAHKGEIDVLSWSWGIAQSGTMSAGGGGGAGKASFSDLSFMHGFDKASPALMTACATGAHIKDATLTARKAGKGQQEFLKIDANIMRLEDLAIKIKIDSLEGKPANPGLTEQVSLNFSKIEVEYKAQKLDGDQTAVTALDNFQAALFPELSGGGNFEGGVIVPPPNKTTG